MRGATSSWASCPRRRPSHQLRLFAFPHAGGTAASYRGWADKLPPQIELWCIDLPGRERRLAEPPIPSVTAIATALVDGLRPLLDEPFAFFGHSMGAVVAYELALRLPTLPRTLVVSAHRAPHLPSPLAIAQLPREEFLAELQRLNGTPPDVLSHEELLQLLMPMLRADTAADESYAPTSTTPIACPIMAYGGEDDTDVPSADLEAWRAYTAAAFRMRLFPGDHFYLRDGVLRVLAEDVLGAA